MNAFILITYFSGAKFPVQEEGEYENDEIEGANIDFTGDKPIGRQTDRRDLTQFQGVAPCIQHLRYASTIGSSNTTSMDSGDTTILIEADSGITESRTRQPELPQSGIKQIDRDPAPLDLEAVKAKSKNLQESATPTSSSSTKIESEKTTGVTQDIKTLQPGLSELAVLSGIDQQEDLDVLRPRFHFHSGNTNRNVGNPVNRISSVLPSAKPPSYVRLKKNEEPITKPNERPIVVDQITVEEKHPMSSLRHDPRFVLHEPTPIQSPTYDSDEVYVTEQTKNKMEKNEEPIAMPNKKRIVVDQITVEKEHPMSSLRHDPLFVLNEPTPIESPTYGSDEVDVTEQTKAHPNKKELASIDSPLEGNANQLPPTSGKRLLLLQEPASTQDPANAYDSMQVIGKITSKSVDEHVAVKQIVMQGDDSILPPEEERLILLSKPPPQRNPRSGYDSMEIMGKISSKQFPTGENTSGSQGDVPESRVDTLLQQHPAPRTSKLKEADQPENTERKESISSGGITSWLWSFVPSWGRPPQNSDTSTDCKEEKQSERLEKDIRGEKLSDISLNHPGTGEEEKFDFLSVKDNRIIGSNIKRLVPSKTNALRKEGSNSTQERMTDAAAHLTGQEKGKKPEHLAQAKTTSELKASRPECIKIVENITQASKEAECVSSFDPSTNIALPSRDPVRENMDSEFVNSNTVLQEPGKCISKLDKADSLQEQISTNERNSFSAPAFEVVMPGIPVERNLIQESGMPVTNQVEDDPRMDTEKGRLLKYFYIIRCLVLEY